MPFLVGGLFFPTALPSRFDAWVWFAVALALAALVSFGIRYLVALSVFWLLDGTGVNQVMMICGVFFSGMVLPLNAFPGGFGDVARALPWAAQLQVPADVLMGETGVAGACAFQAMWAVVLLAAGRWCSRRPRDGWWCRVAERTGVVEGLRAYRMIAGMWVRSGMTYRVSFVVTLFGNLVMTGMDFAGILLMFSQVDSLVTGRCRRWRSCTGRR